ncbi:hypothetical protein BAZMOX_309186_0 [methanotrophic endosymbiont of Bathymodiolus azoricus (Menez Gwen)]|nr:hypothetical protein BAZMOX_309186_0 [methanotrophic endosymbiont of Bathymodiolus azoricus (Menez Gwen)]
MFISLRKYTRVTLYIVIAVTLNACTTTGTAQITDQAIVSWGADEGIKRLEESQYKVEFFLS